MQCARAVQADPNQKMLVVKELAPLIVEQRAVGLQRVLNAHSRLFIFLLQGYRLAEKIQPHERWLATLPGKNHFGHLLGLDILAGVVFQHFIRHAETALGIQILFLKIKAVLAVEIANSPAGLDHNMEGRWRLVHGFSELYHPYKAVNLPCARAP